MSIQAPCQLQFSAKNYLQLADSETGLVESATDSWEFSPREPRAGVARYSSQVRHKG
jgi:hypothetical protein